MNTPRAPKPPKRWKPQTKPSPHAEGGYFGIVEPKAAAAFGFIITYWPHIEEWMIRVLDELLTGERAPHMSGRVSPAARQVWSSVINAQARIKIMRTLLEKGPQNVAMPGGYDAILDEFDSLNDLRNRLVHGLWMTDHDRKRVMYWPAAVEEHTKRQPLRVTVEELEHVEARMKNLMQAIHARNGTS